MHVAVNPPSSVVTVINVVPIFFAKTTPVLLTDATDESDDDHVTFVLDASVGATFAVKVAVLLGAILNFDLLIETPVTATCGASVFVYVYVLVTVPALLEPVSVNVTLCPIARLLPTTIVVSPEIVPLSPVESL